jgi:hypothetical protein
MMRFKSQSIRSKIFMLVILGIISVTGISGFAKYSAAKKNTYINVLKNSQMVETLMAQVMMTEEKFINTLDQKALSGLEDRRRKLDEALGQIQSLDVGAQIGSDAAAMSKTEAEHARIFQETATGLDEMDKAKSALFTKIESLDAQLKKIVKIIETEESLLVISGEVLDGTWQGLRKELCDLLVIMADRTLSVQDLFLRGDVSKYQAARKAIEKDQELKTKNIGGAITTAGSVKAAMKTQEAAQEVMAKARELDQPWKAAQPLMAEIATIEDTVFNLWSNNNDLKKTLETTAVQIQEKSKSISERSNAIIEDSNRW